MILTLLSLFISSRIVAQCEAALKQPLADMAVKGSVKMKAASYEPLLTDEQRRLILQDVPPEEYEQISRAVTMPDRSSSA